jgi:Flp pilus assembly protein TadG
MTVARSVHARRRRSDVDRLAVLATDRGAIAVEMVLVAPVLITLLLLVVGLGRMAHTRGQVDGAAADAARTASMARTQLDAQQAGEQAARDHLGNSCRRVDIAVDTARLRPGGSVTASVSCVASLAGLGLAGFPGARTFTATATAPIDTYRGR